MVGLLMEVAVGPMAVDMVEATATQEVPVVHRLGGEGSLDVFSATDGVSSLLSTDFNFSFNIHTLGE